MANQLGTTGAAVRFSSSYIATTLFADSRSATNELHCFNLLGNAWRDRGDRQEMHAANTVEVRLAGERRVTSRWSPLEEKFSSGAWPAHAEAGAARAWEEMQEK